MFGLDRLEEAGTRGRSAAGDLHQDEATKKILRSLSEISKRLDENLRRCRSVQQIFTGPELVGLRVRLRGLLQKHLQLDIATTEFGNSILKSVELEWRKCSYEPIAAAKKFKSGVSPAHWASEEKCYLLSHLLNGIGHYHNLIMFIDSNVDTNSTDFDFANVKTFSLGSGKDKEPSAVDKQVPDQLVHRCLLCLGDLTRYQLELVTGPEKDRISSVSRRYYHQALLHRPDSGLPYNQLATLAADHNFGLNSVFYYLRSLTVNDRFEGSESNLQRFFDRKATKFDRVSNPGNDEPVEDENVASEAGDQAEVAVIHLLRLCKEILFEDSSKNLPKFCQAAVKSFQRCLYLAADNDQRDKLSEEIVTKMVLSILLLMVKAQEKGNGNNEFLSAAEGQKPRNYSSCCCS